MSDFEIDFENEVGRYEIEPATSAEVEKWRAMHPKDLEGMSDSEASLDLAYLVRKGRFKTMRPTSAMLEKSVRALVECKKTPFHKVALTVANTIGFWGGDKHQIGIWQSLAMRLQLMFAGKGYVHVKQVQWPHPAAQYVGDLGVFLVPNRDGRPVLALRPHDFQDALILCAARMIATGTKFRICEYCNSPFLAGGAGRGRKKRGDARFCSAEHRWSHHNKVRREAR
jgi:hypothetical protein